MNKPIVAILLALFVSGCSKGGGTGEEVVVPKGTNSGMAATSKPVPGLQETQKICTQCHAMPNPSQHHPAAWPSIVARMEGHMVANRKPTPNQSEREAIIGYLQSGWQK